jgi:hypothetical protein
LRATSIFKSEPLGAERRVAGEKDMEVPTPDEKFVVFSIWAETHARVPALPQAAIALPMIFMPV